MDHLEGHDEVEVSKTTVIPATVSRAPDSPATDPRSPAAHAILPDTEDYHAEPVGRYSHHHPPNSTDFLPLDYPREHSSDTRKLLPLDAWESESDRFRPDSIETHHNSQRHRRGESKESSHSIGKEFGSLQGERQSHSKHCDQYTNHHSKHYNHRLAAKRTSQNDLGMPDKVYEEQSDKCKSKSHSRRRYGLIGLVRDLVTEPGVSDGSDRERSLSTEVRERSVSAEASERSTSAEERERSMSAEVRKRSLSTEVRKRSTSTGISKSPTRTKHKDEEEYSHSRSEREDRYCIHPN